MAHAATSAITLLTSIHGRDRRHLRSIAKRDLQAAVKHGTKSRAYPCRQTWAPRWKYTFAHIVYITDATSTREITSYVEPIVIDAVPMTRMDDAQHRTLKAHLLAHPELCTSHSVVVIDQSGSMRTCDVENFRTRSDAVFGTIALDLIGQHLDDAASISGTDVLTLIEMRDGATTVLHREPITNVLFNMVLARMQTAAPRSHGNYVPALEAAIKAMALDVQEESCAVMLMFLSDGKPSDVYCGIETADTLDTALATRMKTLGDQFGGRLRVGTIGFAAAAQDMQVLERMALAAVAAGAHGTFSHSESTASSLSTAVTALRSDLSGVRTCLTTTGFLPTTALSSSRGRSLQVVGKEQPFRQLTPELWTDGQWDVYASGVRRFVLGHDRDEWVAVPMQEPTATALAIRKNIFAEGAERIVYQLCECAPPIGTGTRGPLLAGKDSRFIVQDDDMEHFHKVFCKTQRKAGVWADKFNVEVARRAPGRNIAAISFLDCSVYQFGIYEYILAEKLLDHAAYKKWNGNNGYVAGQGAACTPTIQNLLKQLEVCDAIAEGSDEDEDDDGRTQLPGRLANDEAIDNPELVPQAFSHFTYRRSKRRSLVCDLQGVYDDTANVFELTDPVIHYAGSKKRKYGRTDHGNRGMHDFFITHECNALCKLLRL
ncbi:Aste57867_13762 [Aphanomyces stellatus]|uniref:Aste57867_13762 protein n=1 Tax=Aphanomyces stellatus TaxID=120398 RepID=A0A485KYZ0_9STRA|nr:hypothetical protein As57867_013712 [Aphanomyces stellatus]VFT90595.1 Aste57867_13762 [Aphanomyces stellatus]